MRNECIMLEFAKLKNKHNTGFALHLSFIFCVQCKYVFEAMSCLGSDIWKEIVSYLESEDIVFLLRLCKWMRNILLEAKHSGLDMRYKSLCQLHAKEIIVRENGIKKISHPHDVTSLILLNVCHSYSVA